MPDGMGHAKSFFDATVPHGELNLQRGMLQFANGGQESPEPDDLLVFGGFGFGHVAIVSRVGADDIEVVQQNIFGRPRQTHRLERAADGGYRIDGASGWLRVRPANAN